MNIKTIDYKVLQEKIDGELYRSDTSILLSYDLNSNKYLFRALNSNYFLQDDKNEVIKLLTVNDAEQVWNAMPHKHVNNKTAAFPQNHGGIGIDTYTNLYDDF